MKPSQKQKGAMTVNNINGGGQSTAERLAKEHDENNARIRQEREDMCRCANAIFSTPAGRTWARKAFKVLGVRKEDPSVFNNPLILAADKALYMFYLKMFKDLVSPEIMLEIENEGGE